MVATGDPSPPPGPLVGRSAEQRALRALIGAPGPAGGAAMLTGEAGMGKTALLTQLAGSAAALAGTRVLWLRGEESEAVLAFAAAADLLLPMREHFTRLPDGQRLALEACLAISGAEPCGPLLAVCAGALGVLAAAADRGPLLLLVDDFQWIDPESQKILLFIARRVLAEPIAMIIAVREEPGHPSAPPGRRRCHIRPGRDPSRPGC